MLFQCVRENPVRGLGNVAYLVIDNWDDFKYKSLFHLFVTDSQGELIEIGAVKIATFGMGDLGGRTTLPETFEALSAEHFSLGQDITYYENLNSIDPMVRDEVLSALRDTAADPGLYEDAFPETVFQTSLLRTVDPVTAEVQFRRLVRRDAKTVAYKFVFKRDGLTEELGREGIEFAVSPDSSPATNIHILIGSNGSGKTRTLTEIGHSLTQRSEDSNAVASVALSGDSEKFAGLVTASFSAFDRKFIDHSGPAHRKGYDIRMESIGLHKVTAQADGQSSTMKSSNDLSEEFSASLAQCIATGRQQRWVSTIEFLLSDPLLDELNLQALVDPGHEESRARDLFDDLSSGHKIVLLTVTRLVELVQERTLVLLDEPETHLHPPLLSAFVNALSYLLAETNGVAVVATHSPVVLQEVPRSCVWIMNRSGTQVMARRPSQETFAENVGELTHEVFSLEVTESGYHSHLVRAASQVSDYAALVRFFDGQLGREGRAIARSLVSMRRED